MFHVGQGSYIVFKVMKIQIFVVIIFAYGGHVQNLHRTKILTSWSAIVL